MKLIAAFFISSLLVGQVPTSLNFGSPAVSAPIPSATKVGATGFTNTFYWVVARTPGGYSSPGAAIATNTVGSANFSGANYVVISWPAISGATGYDVIRSDSPSYPASTSCASCAVALNQAGTSFSDQGGSTSAYSGGAQSVASQAIFTLDNVTVATPQVNVQILNSRHNVTFTLPSTGVGSVTSVGMTVPGALLSVSGSPITTSGTLAVSLVTQSANCVFAGPTSGGAATPTCRALVSADLPAGVGTVTSVGLSLPGIFTVSGSPVTTTGTLTGTLATQTANTVWAGPTTGAAAAPTFRVLVAADMPAGVIPTGNAVGGATNLATAGAIPYVSAPGVLNINAANLFWDNANARLGIGTNAPSVALDVVGNIKASGLTSGRIPLIGTGGLFGDSAALTYNLAYGGAGRPTFLVGDTSGNQANLLQTTSTGAYLLRTTGANWEIFDNNASLTRLLVRSTGSVGIGTSNITPANATLSILDATPSTGATATWIGHDGSGTYSGVHLSALTTKMMVVEGLTQGGTNLVEVQSKTGTVLASVSSAGYLTLPAGSSSIATFIMGSKGAFSSDGNGVFIGNGSAVGAGSSPIFNFDVNSQRLGMAGFIGFGASTPTSLDTSLSRCAAGIVCVGTGAAGSVAGVLQAAQTQALGNLAGVHSTSGILGSGTWDITGTATTSKPYLLIEPAGTTSTGWSAAGTGIGVNAASGFAGNLMDLQVAGVSKASIQSGGEFQGPSGAATYIKSQASQNIVLYAPSGVIGFQPGGSTQFLMTGGGLLQGGGATSSFPAFKRSTTGWVARLADDSADTWFQASQFRSTLTTPASASATCTAGTIVADTGFVYVCTATDTWKRVAIATW